MGTRNHLEKVAERHPAEDPHLRRGPRGFPLLPGGYGLTCLDSTPNDGTWDGSSVVDACDGLGTTYAIKVWWLDDRRSGLATTDPNAYLRVVTTLQPQP